MRERLAIKTSTIKESVIQESNVNNFDEKYMNYIQLSEEIDQKIDQLVDFKREVRSNINLINDQRYRVILRNYYINLWTLEEIAEDLNYYVSWVKKLHKRALQSYQNILKKRSQN